MCLVHQSHLEKLLPNESLGSYIICCYRHVPSASPTYLAYNCNV
jgi:hypothetical protein